MDGVQRALFSVDDQSVHAVLHPVGVDVCLALIVDGGNGLIPAVQREPGHDGLHNAYAALGVGHLITGYNMGCSGLRNGVRHKANSFVFVWK